MGHPFVVTTILSQSPRDLFELSTEANKWITLTYDRDKTMFEIC